jgi:hypothetical protein
MLSSRASLASLVVEVLIPELRLSTPGADPAPQKMASDKDPRRLTFLKLHAVRVVVVDERCRRDTRGAVASVLSHYSIILS